jgi:hypothetical protein
MSALPTLPTLVPTLVPTHEMCVMSLFYIVFLLLPTLPTLESLTCACARAFITLHENASSRVRVHV